MKRLLYFVFVAFHVFGSAFVVAAESKPVPPVADSPGVVKPLLAGRYAGTWTSSEGVTGELRITLRPDSGSAWIADVIFTFDGGDVPAQVKSIQVDGQKVRLTIDWRIQETPGQSKLSGELDGDRLKGNYESSTAEGSTRGTWSLLRA